jgi:hypothetical protein
VRPVILSKEAEDKLSMRQWEAEPPPEGGYEVVLIQHYGSGAEEFVDEVQDMSRHDPDMAMTTVLGCLGVELTDEEILFVQLGGLTHDGHGNLLLQRRERLKEVQAEIKRTNAEEFKRRLDDLIKGIKRSSEEGDKEEE